jgi:predicted nucleotidyltransferase
VESGSRAWGCPSPDSDYDVRIIYKRAKSDYLRIDEKPDAIDYFHGELLDINGWDIKKAFKLIRKSNATPFEWAQSPIVYKEVDDFSSKLLSLSRAYFQARHSINHYKGIATNSYLSNKFGDAIKLKKLFYVLRPLMAAKWIIQKNEIPPMDIPNLISIVEDKSITDHIKQLLEIKAEANEDYIHKVDPLIANYIKEEFDFIRSTNIIDEKIDLSADRLNKVFMELIQD